MLTDPRIGSNRMYQIVLEILPGRCSPYRDTTAEYEVRLALQADVARIHAMGGTVGVPE
jgi:hypothetical protein